MLQLVLARIIQAGSKLDSRRVLGCIARDLDLDHHDKFVAEPQHSVEALRMDQTFNLSFGQSARGL